MSLFKHRLLTPFFFTIVYITILLFIKTHAISLKEDDYVSSLRLLNGKHAIVAKDGIHFYNKEFNEEITKKVDFNFSISSDNMGQIRMAQFSEDNGEFILILINNVLYIFDGNENELISIKLGHRIKPINYSLIPNKKSNNHLYFIISYVYSNSLILINCKYSLIIKNVKKEKKIFYVQDLDTDLKGARCIFMNPPLSLLHSPNSILTCFYYTNKEIFSIFFKQDNNLNEIISLKSNISIPVISNGSIYLNTKTNENKQKALIYMLLDNNIFWLTFDFINKFSNIFQERFDKILSSKYDKLKLFYFKETREFILVSSFINCHKLIMIYNNDFNLKYKGIIHDEYSKYNFSDCNVFFTLSYDGNNYQIINSKGYSKSFTEIESIFKDNKRHLDENYLGDIKCRTSTSESAVYKLCTSCNTVQQYFPADFNNINLIISSSFVECYNDQTKPVNSYFDSDDSTYKLCYETCHTCIRGGNYEENNCLTCASNHIKKPGYPDSTNCVTECYYSYYYTPYGYYKCSNSSNCPDDANLYIRELKKCTDDCNKEDNYKYQYGGQCLASCPENTIPNEKKICIEVNVNSCAKSETEIDLQEFLTSGGVDSNAKNYATEFSYTEKHVSLFYNSIYNILIYQDTNCISELSINMPKIDFGNCYDKIQSDLKHNEKIIIALIQRNNGKGEKKSTSYNFYDPKTGDKLDIDELCKDEEIIVKENIISILNESETTLSMDSLLYLTQQNIDIFNLSNEFYTDICYHFDSPNGKDVPFQDRIHIYYPNLTLCELGCVTQGVNFTTMESICQCKINDIMSNEFISGNAIVESALGEIADIISSSNLLVLTCYKDVFTIDYIMKGTGGFIVIGIFVIEIIFALIFLINDMKFIRNYLFNMTQYYVIYLTSKNEIFTRNTRDFLTSIDKLKSSPPHKKVTSSTSEKSSTMFPKQVNSKEYLKISKKETTKKLTRYKSSKKSMKNILFNSDKKGTNIKNELTKAKKNCGNIDIEEYLKPDKDDMEYDDAIKLDKRSFCEYLNDSLKEKQIIMETFFYKENIKPMSIKILLLILNINLYFVVNGLFFNETYIIKVYEADENENFLGYIGRSYSNFFYSLLVGFFIDVILDLVFIDEKKIKRIFLREKNDLMQLKYEISVNTKSIKNRYVVFIIICFFVAIISWYYVSCFNCVYPGVKNEWIKSSVTIIFIMQIISVLMRIIESILRSISFECKSEKIYKVKKYLS